MQTDTWLEPRDTTRGDPEGSALIGTIEVSAMMRDDVDMATS